MSKKIVIQDTADVILTEIATGKVVLNAETQLAGISGTVSEEDLYGSIGNKKLYRIRSQKDINLSVRSAFASMDYWAMQQGVEIDNAGTATVTRSETCLPVVDNSGTLEVTISDATISDGFIIDKDGSQDPITFNSGVAILPTGTAFVAGDVVDVFYKTTVAGNSIKIDSDKFSTAYRAELRTISYDPDTAKVYSDIYFIFPKVIPSGEFEINLENGQVYTPELNFSVMGSKCSSELGQIIEEVRP